MASSSTVVTKTITRNLLPRVRRAFLYLQGYDGKKVAKAAAHPTLDCVCLDMEDGVGVSRKDDARTGILHALREVDFGRTERVVRINAFDTGDLALRDLDALLQSPVLPDAVCIPKCETFQDIQQVSDQLDALGDDVAGQVRIIGMIESAQAVLNMKEICSASQHRLDCVIFGGDDYASTVGATRTSSNHELWYARNSCLMQAKAYGLDAIDIVCIDFHNLEQLEQESREGFEMGYTGKQVIHPKQIDPVQQAYSPSMESIEHAAAVVAANEEHQTIGTGAFSFQGKMIDMPTVKQYENLLQRAKLMGTNVKKLKQDAAISKEDD